MSSPRQPEADPTPVASEPDGKADVDIELVGAGEAFWALERRIAKVAATDATVLVEGETGTGKEAVARRIHQLSARRDRGFVVVDFAAMHDNLFLSELFGHEQGSFTGATRQKSGLFQEAAGGTVFLDEIGEASPVVQAGLLRVLESRSFRRVGSTQATPVDLRVISATNRDLQQQVGHNLFRQDLYYRLSTVTISLAPLRQRRDEIPGLVEHFIARLNQRLGMHRRVSSSAMDALVQYRWPGNVRELQHVLEGALVLADSDDVTVEDLGLKSPLEAAASAAVAHAAPSEAPHPDAPALADPLPPADSLLLNDVERRHILAVLASVGGKRALAAQLLGISERSLYRWLHKLPGHHFDDREGNAH